MDLQLEGKTAYVTGAAHGIGAAIADELTAEGVRVAVSDIDAHELDRRSNEWSPAGRTAVCITADLGTEAGAVDAAQRAVEGLGGAPDILVNNVGVAPNKAFDDLTEEDWRASFELNFMSAVRSSRTIVPGMAERGSGAVITISSDLAKQPEPVPADYGAFKTALTSWSKSMATHYAPAGVRVNVVCPGPIWTRLWSRPGGVIDDLAEIYELPREQTLERFLSERRLLLGMGEPVDVAKVVAFLASPAAKFITAGVYDVNGGSVRSLH